MSRDAMPSETSKNDGLVGRVRALADALRADLRTTGEPFTVECVALGTAMDDLGAALEWAGESVPEWVPVMISVGHPDGGCTLVFSTEGDFAYQATHNIEQLQDEVAEITTEQWPACPEHNHDLYPAPHETSFVWMCDRSAAVVAAVGGLSGRA